MSSPKSTEKINRIEGAQDKVGAYIRRLMLQIEKPAAQGITVPYLSITDKEQLYGETLYVWDAYHTALRFAYDGRPDYLRHLVDAVLAYQKSDGYVPNRIHRDDGPVECLPRWHAQPFLMQSAYSYSLHQLDTAWLQRVFPKLESYLGYYEENCRAANGLFTWPLSHMSGIDNDIVTTFFFPGTVIPCDLSSWITLEYRAAAQLAEDLGDHALAEDYLRKTECLKGAINSILWCEQEKTYTAYNVLWNRQMNEVSFRSCSNLIPLYAGIPSTEQALEMLKRHVLNADHFLSDYGIRSLSKSSEYNNNAKWGNPPRFGPTDRLTNSNWQGPLWVLLDYFMVNACLYYDLRDEARELSHQTINRLARSLDTHGSFYENYHAETGEPLYVKGFASWNLLADVLLRLIEDPESRIVAKLLKAE